MCQRMPHLSQPQRIALYNNRELSWPAFNACLARATTTRLVLPVSLRRRLRELIDNEAAHARAGRPARIIPKKNGLTDSPMIQHLYRASQAGVQLDLIVRGICCPAQVCLASAIESPFAHCGTLSRALASLLVRKAPGIPPSSSGVPT